MGINRTIVVSNIIALFVLITPFTIKALMQKQYMVFALGVLGACYAVKNIYFYGKKEKATSSKE